MPHERSVATRYLLQRSPSGVRGRDRAGGPRQRLERALQLRGRRPSGRRDLTIRGVEHHHLLVVTGRIPLGQRIARRTGPGDAHVAFGRSPATIEIAPSFARAIPDRHEPTFEEVL